MRNFFFGFWGMRRQDYLLLRFTDFSDRKTFANFQMFSQTQELSFFSVFKKSTIFSFCVFQTNILLKKSSSDLQANLK